MADAFANHKVLVIGVDGGTFDVLQPMMERGLLPTFARLMRQGSWGTLRSSVPHVSPVAWASFMTGQNPARHRILDFTFARPGSDLRLPVNATHLEGKTLWQLLSEAGKRVGVINVPVTFPPQPVNGFLVSGFPMPLDTKEYTYPPTLAAEMEGRGWRLADIAVDIPTKAERDASIAGLYRREEERLQATLWLMEREPWDLIMLHLFESDRLQHEILNCWVRWQAGATDAAALRYGPELERFFRVLDQDIARLLDHLARLAPDHTVVVMSDHGFGPTYKAAHLYNWLRDEGFLHLKRDGRARLKQALARAGMTPFNLYRLMPDRMRRQLRRQTDVSNFEKGKKLRGPGRTLARWMRQSAYQMLLSYQDVDWSRTRAFCTGNSGIVHIVINLQGREPQGCVPPAEYEATRDEIIAALRGWTDPVDGGPVISEVYRREELYSGPYLHEAADILAVLRGDSEYYAFNGPVFLSNQAIDQHDYRDRANHKLNGIFIVNDARVRADHHARDAQIIDLAPTLLHLMGLPIPDNMDGAVMEECFQPAWLAAHPPRRVAAAPSGANGSEDGTFTPEEEASMIEMLRGLGYVQ